MPRSSGSSRSSSSTARAPAKAAQPPQQNNQLAPSRGSGIMGSLMSGMAFGAASEFVRQLFRNPTVGPYMMPLILSGLAALGSNKLLFHSHPKKGVITAAVFAGTFLLTKNSFSGEAQH